MAAFSEENQNFFRLYYVLNQFGTKALNEVLRHVVYQTFPPAMTLSDFLALHQVQNELCPVRTRSCLDPMQRELLYPSGVPSTTLDYGDLDITLVSTLLKNLTVFSGILKQPGSCSRTLWANPTEHDQRLYKIEANVVLLKNKRNSTVHSKKPSLPNEEFQADFDQVKSLVMNIMRLVGSAAFNEDDIEQYRNSPLSPELFQETAAKLLESLKAAEDNKELKDKVKKLIEEQIQMEERLVRQIVRLTKKTRYRVIASLFIATVVIFGMLVLNRISTEHEFEEGVKSREKLEKELEEIKKSSEGKGKRKRKNGIGIVKLQLRREKDEDLENRKQKLRDAIKMHPNICFLWRNEDEKMKEKQIENCIDWLLKRNVQSSFHFVPPINLPSPEHKTIDSCKTKPTTPTKRTFKKEKEFAKSRVKEPIVLSKSCKPRKFLKDTVCLKMPELKEVVQDTSKMYTEMKNMLKDEL